MKKKIVESNVFIVKYKISNLIHTWSQSSGIYTSSVVKDKVEK